MLPCQERSLNTYRTLHISLTPELENHTKSMLFYFAMELNKLHITFAPNTENFQSTLITSHILHEENGSLVMHHMP